MSDANELLDNFDKAQCVELSSLIKLFAEKIKRFTEMSESINETIEKDKEFNIFAEETFQQEIKYKRLLNKLELKLSESKNCRRAKCTSFLRQNLNLFLYQKYKLKSSVEITQNGNLWN